MTCQFTPDTPTPFGGSARHAGAGRGVRVWAGCSAAAPRGIRGDVVRGDVVRGDVARGGSRRGPQHTIGAAVGRAARVT